MVDSLEPAKRPPTLRIGCVQYLNARPLIHGWPDPVVFGHPAALCAKLARGDLDLALVSSFEFLRNPIYRVVDGVAISSDGPVYSVVVAHLGEISEIEEIELDAASETSVNLLRCLLAEKELDPRFAAASTSAITQRRARLLIGDQAIRYRSEHEVDLHFWDLGEHWKKLVDLPFVYALWLVRPEVGAPSEIANRLRALRDTNLTNLDQLIAEEKGFSPEFCACYYRKHLRFGFGEREKDGLRTFANLCEKCGLLSEHNFGLDLV
ncbi:MAG: menaquinone biosynthesis protein [Verrucomicrobiota bacterium]